MRILQINSVLNTGSTGRIAEEIGSSVLAAGYESYIAYGRSYRDSKSQVYRIGSDLDLQCHGIATRLFDNHGLASRKATRLFIEEIKRIRPNIIHLHNIHGYYLNYKLLFEYLSTTDLPIVWTLHDCWPITGHCAYYSMVKCNRWVTGCFGCPQVNSYPSSFLFDNSKHNWYLKKKVFNSLPNLTLVSVSNWLNNEIKKSYLKDCKHKVIVNGIDLDIFKYSENTHFVKKYNLKNKFVSIAVATIWDKRKNLNDYIRLSEFFSDDEVLILVGISNKQISNLPANIIGLERTENQQELVDLYSLADVCLNLSLEETFGLTTVEAFACGTPGVVYNSTASPELIISETGFIVEPGDLDGVLTSMRIIKKNGKLSYSSACRKRAEDNYNKKDRYQEYINLYRSLLNR